MFQPYGIITALPMELGGKTVSIVVEVIDTPLEYNMLLGSTWFYQMTAFVSSIFKVLCFPHQGKIMMIYQLEFYTPDLGSNVRSNVPFVDDTMQYALNIGAKMFKYPSIMGIFPLPPPYPTAIITPINMIYSFTSGSLGSVDPWVVPCYEDVESF
jgi:hypothetical protein